jgi:hypothetical protein
MRKKQLVKDLKAIVDKYGYWSKEVKEFNSKLDFKTMEEVNNTFLSKAKI